MIVGGKVRPLSGACGCRDRAKSPRGCRRCCARSGSWDGAGDPIRSAWPNLSLPGYPLLDSHANGCDRSEKGESKAIRTGAGDVAWHSRVDRICLSSDARSVIDGDGKLGAIEVGWDVKSHLLYQPEAAITVVVAVHRGKIVGRKGEIERTAVGHGRRADRRPRRIRQPDERSAQLVGLSRSRNLFPATPHLRAAN